VAIKSYKFRIYPTKTQRDSLYQMLFISRVIYNRLLAHRKHEWELRSRHVYRDEQQRFMKQWRNAIDDGFLPSQMALCTSVRRLEKAMKAFFRRIKSGDSPGYPRFKGRHFWNSLEATAGKGQCIRLDGQRLYVLRVGRIRVRWHRQLPEGAKIKYGIISVKNNRWYVVLQCEIPEAKKRTESLPVVGIDVGIRWALALSDGAVYEAPKPLQASLAKKRRLNRSLARKKGAGGPGKKSLRWHRIKRQIARLDEHIANQRRDWQHKVTTELVNKYGGFVLEKLSLKFMTQNSNLSRTVHDIGLGGLRTMLETKAAALGLPVVYVDAKYTSQTCPACGAVKPKSLKERAHVCECGFEADRDVSAAIVILQRAIEGEMLPAGANVDGCVMRSPRIPTNA